MTRRKVTMLEAFQASAKESAERAAAERRRLIAEREKEIRRVESARSGGSSTSEIGVEALFQGRSVHDAPIAESVEADAAASGAAPDRMPAESDPGRLDSRQQDSPNGDETPAVPVDLIGPTRDSTEGAVSLDEAFGAATISPAAPASIVARAPVEPSESELDLDAAVLRGGAAFDDTVFSLPMTGRGFLFLQAVLIAGIFVIGWAVGHRTTSDDGGETSAAGEGPGHAASALDLTPFGSPRSTRGAASPNAPTPGQAAPAQASAPASDPDPDTAADRAFRHPAMRFTVLAKTGTSNETSIVEAWAAYDLLLAEGFPVVKPLQRLERIFLFVDAAEARAQLQDVRDRLRNLRTDAEGAPDFRDARVVNLDLYRD